jgi:hypothetical protein
MIHFIDAVRIRIARRFLDAIAWGIAGWVLDIIWKQLDRAYRAILRQLMKARPLVARTGGRIRATWNVVRNLGDMAIVDMRTGEIHLGAGA